MITRVNGLVSFFDEPGRKPELVGVIPEGASVIMYKDWVVFTHPKYPARMVRFELLQAAKPLTIEEWLYLGEEITL